MDPRPHERPDNFLVEALGQVGSENELLHRLRCTPDGADLAESGGRTMLSVRSRRTARFGIALVFVTAVAKLGFFAPRSR